MKVIGQIRTLLRDGQYRPGDRLPSEREVYAAGRAAERRTDEDIRRIESALSDMYAVAPGAGNRGSANRRFHRVVASAAHNTLLEYVPYCLLEASSSYIRNAAPAGTGKAELHQWHERDENDVPYWSS